MAFDDLLNVLLVGVLVIVFFFQQVRKKAKQQEEEDYKKATQQKQSLKKEKPVQKQKIREYKNEPHVHEALSDRYTDDPSYEIEKEKKTSFGRKLLQDKSSIKKGIIISEIMKRPYDL